MSDVIFDSTEPIDFTTLLVAAREGTALETVILTDRAGVVQGADYSAAVSTLTLDALLALARRVIDDTPPTALGAADETIFFDWEGQQAICRPFSAGGGAWILTALAPHGKAHKQATSRAIKAIQSALKPPTAPKKSKIAKPKSAPKPKAAPKPKSPSKPKAAPKAKSTPKSRTAKK